MSTAPTSQKPTGDSTGPASAGGEGTTKPAFDIEAFSLNVARIVEKGGKALAEYMKPRESGELRDKTAEEIAEIVKTFAVVIDYWMSDPQRLQELQARLGRAYLDLWGHAAKRLSGEPADPVIAPAARDRRFSDPESGKTTSSSTSKQAYLLTTKWAEELVTDAEGLDPHARHKAAFYVQQITNALAPSTLC